MQESKRTLKNPFASRLAEFNTNYNFSGLQINDILFPLSFDLGEIWSFWRLKLLLPLAGGPKDGKRFDANHEGFFLLPASIQAQIIVKGIRINETATIKTVRKKPLRN